MLESILPTKFVDIVSVHTNASRSEFSQDEVEKLARNFLLSGGSTKPLIVRPKNAEEFDVIEGHLEFYAALRAKELDDNFEMIQAIILDSKNEKAITEQVDLFKKLTPDPDNKIIIERIKNLEEHLSSDINHLKNQLSNQTELTNLENILKSQLDALKSDINHLKNQLSNQTELTNLENILKSQLDALKNDLMGEKFIQEIANRVAKLIIITPPPPPGKKTIKELEEKPIKLNTASKSDLLTVPGIDQQKASDIINRRETKKFQNINELAEIKYIGLKTIQKWDKCFDLS